MVKKRITVAEQQDARIRSQSVSRHDASDIEVVRAALEHAERSGFSNLGRGEIRQGVQRELKRDGVL
jgi:hypothetical protein